MNRCKWVETHISDFIDDSLESQMKREFLAHLDECPRCKETVDRVKALNQNLNHLHQLRASDDFDTILKTRIRIESGLERSSIREKMVGWSIKTPIYAASFAVIFLVFFIMYQYNNQSSTYIPFAPKSLSVADSNYNNTNQLQQINYEIGLYSVEYFTQSQPQTGNDSTIKESKSDTLKRENENTKSSLVKNPYRYVRPNSRYSF